MKNFLIITHFSMIMKGNIISWKAFIQQSIAMKTISVTLLFLLYQHIIVSHLDSLSAKPMDYVYPDYAVQKTQNLGISEFIQWSLMGLFSFCLSNPRVGWLKKRFHWRNVSIFSLGTFAFFALVSLNYLSHLCWQKLYIYF